jgi:acetylornithine deacetylase/succinyl-diaminopimelate desuccinylase
MVLADDLSLGESELLQEVSACFSDEEILATTIDLVRLGQHRGEPGHETAVAEYIDRLLTSEGIETELQEVRPGRPNVIGVLHAMDDGPRLMFNGHTDAVPPGTMDRPFERRGEDGILYGRGTCDMKGGLSAQLCAVISLRRAGVRLAGDIIFFGVIAEEDGTSLGSLQVVEKGSKADMVVVAEPTGLRVAVAHKGFDYYRVEVDGVAGHWSRPENGINAIYRASGIVTAIEQDLVPRLALTSHRLLGAASINVSSIIGYARSEAATVFGGGVIEKPAGGTVPDICLDHRRPPGNPVTGVLGSLKTVADAASGIGPPLRVIFTPASPELDSHPPLYTDTHHPLVREYLRIAATQTDVVPPLLGFRSGPMPCCSARSGRRRRSCSVQRSLPSLTRTVSACRFTRSCRQRASTRCWRPVPARYPRKNAAKVSAITADESNPNDA